MKKKITEASVKQAIKTIISWIGDDPDRESLKNTPARVLKSYNEIFSGYKIDPQSVLKKTFPNFYTYNDFILLKDIEFVSTCEHHMLPIVGVVHIAYIPSDKIVGISKLARIVEIFAKRLQIQENMNVQIAQTIFSELNALGIAVVIEAEHFCMSVRGINKQHAKMKTSYFLGEFTNNSNLKNAFFNMIC